MADHQREGELYVYRGGRAPNNITHAIIDKSVKVIDYEAFYNNKNLRSVETHDKIDRIGEAAFECCESLTHIDTRSVRILDSYAFADSVLTEVDGDNLEIISDNVFTGCASLRRVAIPKVKRIEACAFEYTSLTDVEFPETLELVEGNAFYGNDSLRRICLPLKADLFHQGNREEHEYLHPNETFDECGSLATVELIGGVHETISSLHMKRWRNDMIQEINQINRTLPNIPSAQKTNVIRWWLQTVHSRIEHYKTEHIKVLKEATVLLELALWKARLDDEAGDDSLEAPTKKFKVDVERTRSELRVTSRANIVIKNVLPFLALK